MAIYLCEFSVLGRAKSGSAVGSASYRSGERLQERGQTLGTALEAASYRIVALLYSFDQRTDALEAPMWIPQSFVTIGLALIALLMGVRLVLARFR